MQWSGGKALIWFKVFSNYFYLLILIQVFNSNLIIYYLKTIVFECIFRYLANAPLQLCRDIKTEKNKTKFSSDL